MNMVIMIKKVLVLLYDYVHKRALHRKACKILANAGKKIILTDPPADILRKYKMLWNIIPAKVESIWVKIYGNISGIWDHRYIPETLYYNIVEPVLNNKVFSKAWTDKNFYFTLLKEFDLPETLVYNIDGVFYNQENKPIEIDSALLLLDKEERIILKPAVDSGGGRRVTLWRREEGRFVSDNKNVLDPDYLLSVYRKNFVIQKVIEQHPFYSSYNLSSVNTIRVLTYRSVKDESIHILHSVFRVGQAGSFTDNQASGGIACGLSENGNLTGKAVDKLGNRYDEVNGIKLIPGTNTEGFQKIIAVARRVAAKFPYSRLLGLDLCLDSKGDVRLIEVNNVNNEINFFQMLNLFLILKYNFQCSKYLL
jgi:hypothetical protein